MRLDSLFFHLLLCWMWQFGDSSILCQWNARQTIQSNLLKSVNYRQTPNPYKCSLAFVDTLSLFLALTHTQSVFIFSILFSFLFFFGLLSYRQSRRRCCCSFCVATLSAIDMCVYVFLSNHRRRTSTFAFEFYYAFAFVFIYFLVRT